ncbi:MAG: glycine dehydrogenase, partial [Fimbriimonadaceae bacterium]
MPYVPHTEQDVAEMLQTIGVKSIDDLFIDIPENLKLKGELNIPSRLDEHALLGKLQSLAEQNTDLTRVTCFLGAGIYDKFIPATVG